MRKFATAIAVPFVGLLFAATAHATSFGGDGTYTVGGDIQPGIYHTTGPADGDSCYWERDRNLDGDLDSIIANDNIRGPATVRISSTDAAFKTDRCATWTLVQPVAPVPAPAPDPAPAPRPAPAPSGSAG
jgi:hypothetical protein